MEFLAFMIFFGSIIGIASMFVTEFLKLICDGITYRKEQRRHG